MAAIDQIAEKAEATVVEAAEDAAHRVAEATRRLAEAAAMSAGASSPAAPPPAPAPNIPNWAAAVADVQMPSGITAPDQALKMMQKQDVELNKRRRRLSPRPNPPSPSA